MEKSNAKSNIFFIFLFFFLCSTIFAQKTEIKGVVRDSLKSTPIEGLVVQVVDGTKIIAFAVTNKTGNFKLTFESHSDYLIINFKHLSYQAKTEKISNKSQQLNAVLNTKEITLREVTVKAPELIHKKDTISFSVAAFQGTADRTIEDVIKKMPGVEVADNGKISYQGKTISKLNIEGLDMLGGKYTLATKNIEAKAVNRVEVMENYQEVKQLQGKEYSDKVAMNLKLKKEATIKPMGAAELGGGYSFEEGLYHAAMSGMAFLSKFQVLGVIKANNLGQSLRSEFENQFGTFIANNTANSLLSNDLGSQPPIEAKRYWQKNEIISSLNGIVKLSTDNRLRAGVDLSNDRSRYRFVSASSYYLDGQYVTFSEDMNPHYNKKQLKGNVDVTINTHKLYLSNSTSLGVELNDNDFNLANNSEKINQLKNSRLYSVQNNLRLFKRTGKKQFYFSSKLGYSASPANKLTFAGVKNKAGDFFQTSTGSLFFTNESFSFSHDVGKLSRLSIEFAFSADVDNIHTHLQQNDTSSFNHNYGFKMVSSVSPSYIIQSPIQRYSLSINFPVSMYNLNFKNDKKTVDFRFNKPFFSPSIGGHYIFTPLLKTEFNAGLNYGIGDITEFILQPIQISYRQQQNHSGILAQNRSTYGRVTFLYENPINMFFANVRINGGQNKRNIIANQQFNTGGSAVDIASTNISSKNVSQNISFDGNVSKRARSINTTFSLRTSYGISSGNTLRESVMTNITNHTFSTSSTISSDVTKKINLSYSVDAALNRQLFANHSATYHQQAHSVNFSGELIKNVFLLSNWNFSRQEISSGNYKNMHLFDAAVRYKNKKAEMELKINNIFNLNEYAYNVFSDLDQFAYSYHLRPREIVVMVKFGL